MEKEQLENNLQLASGKLSQVIDMIERRLVGQRVIAERLLMGLVAGGHVLLEGLPGLAKTTAVRALGDSSDLKVKRIQFTPDLLPADVIGTQIYDPNKQDFEIKKGPIFSNLLIADEINRAPAKVQSALLEAMQERQVTIGDQTLSLEKPFLVMATQNPIEQEGTYRLPEAQVDRFLFKVRVGYSSLEDEKIVMERMSSGEVLPLERVICGQELLDMHRLISKVHVADPIRDYILQLVFATRQPSDFNFSHLDRYIEVGASPRASINLELASRVKAIMAGRSFVIPEDVKEVAFDVMSHRVMPSYEAEAENISSEEIVSQILEGTTVP